MIRNLLFGLTLCLLTTLVDAKGRHGGPPQFDRLAEELALTLEQEDAVREIMREHHDEMRQLDETTGQREARSSIREQTSQQLQSVLSQEQFEQFQAIRPPRRGPGPENQGVENGQ